MRATPGASSSLNLGGVTTRDARDCAASCVRCATVWNGTESFRSLTLPPFQAVPSAGRARTKWRASPHTASRRGGSTRATYALRRETVPHRNPLDSMWTGPRILPRHECSSCRTAFRGRPDGLGSPSYVMYFPAGVITDVVAPVQRKLRPQRITPQRSGEGNSRGRRQMVFNHLHDFARFRGSRCPRFPRSQPAQQRAQAHLKL